MKAVAFVIHHFITSHIMINFVYFPNFHFVYNFLVQIDHDSYECYIQITPSPQKICSHDITEILLKVALNTITISLPKPTRPMPQSSKIWFRLVKLVQASKIWFRLVKFGSG